LPPGGSRKTNQMALFEKATDATTRKRRPAHGKPKPRKK
jgi:hypothetical protein